METSLARQPITEQQSKAVAQKRRRLLVETGSRLLMHLLLILLSLMALVPVLWMISSSLKASTEIFVVPIRWLPTMSPRA